MSKISYVLNKAKDVKLRDCFAVFPMLLAKCLTPFFSKYKNLWLVCEDASEARDNGYWFFKYMRNNQPQKLCVYAINNDSPDFNKVSELGETVRFGSLKHWILYFLCEYNISSQKGGKPNAALCAFLELNHVIKVKQVFLQHGVTINNARWLYSDRSVFTFFITATTEETDFIKQTFGYEEGVVQYTGFSRFDNLHDNCTKDNRILIMPSWRAWFSEKSAQESSEDSDFECSDYLHCWKELLGSEELSRIISAFDLEVIFYPHRNMQRYLEYFRDLNKNITIASSKEYDVQNLLKTSRLLITDYSSVFFDMIYMKKPILFYQFDEEKFRRQQYQQGYFDYHHNPFGDTFKYSSEVIDALEQIIKNDFAISEEYLFNHNKLFELYDSNNSQRIYSLLKNA